MHEHQAAKLGFYDYQRKKRERIISVKLNDETIAALMFLIMITK